MPEPITADLPPDLWLAIAAVLAEEDAIEALLVHVPGEEAE